MELLYDFPTYLEPHYAQMIRAEKLKPITVYPLEREHQAGRDQARRGRAHRAQGQARRRLRCWWCARTSRPTSSASTQGDNVYFHVTNLEQDDDIAHGFGILFSSKNMQIEPGETKTMRWMAEKAGVDAVLLLELLQRAAPGDAGLHRGRSRRHAGRERRSARSRSGRGSRGAHASSEVIRVPPGRGRVRLPAAPHSRGVQRALSAPTASAARSAD